MGKLILPTTDDPVRIIHGDNVMVMQQMDAECADHGFTDSPFGVGAVHNTFKDEYGHRDFQAETSVWGREAYKITKPGGWLIAAMGTRLDSLSRFVYGLEDGGWKLHHSPLAWVRHGSFCYANRLPGNDGSRAGFSPKQEFELIIPASKGRVHNHLDRCQQDGRAPGTIAMSQDPSDGWPFFDINNFWPLETLPFIHCTRATLRELDYGLQSLSYSAMPKSGKYFQADKRNFHPTPKPIKLMCYLLALFTEKNDLIVDPFFGSGTTGIACLIMGRRCIGIEQRADYCRIARLRVSAWRRRVARARKAFAAR